MKVTPQNATKIVKKLQSDVRTARAFSDLNAIVQRKESFARFFECCNRCFEEIHVLVPRRKKRDKQKEQEYYTTCKQSFEAACAVRDILKALCEGLKTLLAPAQLHLPAEIWALRIASKACKQVGDAFTGVIELVEQDQAEERLENKIVIEEALEKLKRLVLKKT